MSGALIGTIAGAARRRGGGVPTFGSASRDFSGTNQYINLGISPSSRADMSIAVWVNRPTLHGNGAIFCAGDYYSGTSSFYLGSRQPVAGTTRIEFSLGSSFFRNVQFTEIVDWAHLVVAYANSTNSFQFYLNGSPAAVSGAGGTFVDIPASSFDYMIGTNGTGVSDFSGGMADLREYDRLLTGSDVSDLYAGTHVASGLVGWWLTNNDDVLDYSGTGNDGTNNGTTYSTDGPLDP